MSLYDTLMACDAEVPASCRDDGPQEARLRHPADHISVKDPTTGRPRASTPPEYPLEPAVSVTYQCSCESEALNGIALDADSSPLAASRGVTSERVLPHPGSQGTGVLRMGGAKESEESLPSQDTKRRNRETHELSPRERELRRPPSPFALLDVDPTRPELPSRLRVVPVTRIR